MKAQEVYSIWAPKEVIWSQWVRPLAFVNIDTTSAKRSRLNFQLPEIVDFTDTNQATALILDLKDHHAVLEGLALAKQGWRPIPIYNGTKAPLGTLAIIDNQNIEYALLWGAEILENLFINPAAAPVFLLDSNRLKRYRNSVTMFDNSWDIYAQDLPSAGYFKEQGINKIIIKGEKPAQDLKKIFSGFLKQEIEVFFTKDLKKPYRLRIKRPLRDKIKEKIWF